MLNDTKLGDILFLDIETVPKLESFELLNPREQELFDKKTKHIRKEEELDSYYNRAGIWAEFGKIVCISIGYFYIEDNQHKLRTTSYYGKKEKLILEAFKKIVNIYFSQNNKVLCAHNGKEFDFPYIARRMIINNVKLPKKLNIQGKKPWEIPHIDTLELWKFGDYKHYTSLDLLTHIFSIASPKKNIDGSMVASVYYNEKDVETIAEYCQDDVIALAQVYLKLKGLDNIDEQSITIVKSKELL
ncbi:MAG: 3'-5' exonuclease [Flavobacteriaceae bacterium]|nr:3'-5' exonuclease [Flavobacteriaceae bacterium]